VVAPAFLRSKKDTTRRKRLAIDETIPELFSGGPAPDAQPQLTKHDGLEQDARPAEVRDDERSAREAALPEDFTAEPVPDEIHAERESTIQLASPVATAAPEIVTMPQPIPAAKPATPSPRPVTPEPMAPPAPAYRGPALTVGQLFGKPEKTDWSPSELVQHVIKLPRVAGAIVALQEGLVVAHELPEHMRGDVVAAFLPQIYARLNQYSNEMKLGEIDEMLFSTNGAQFQLFRLGYVFFAVLGESGAALPGREIRLIADELARQTDK
jgi:predicted regulator of Ras-like GTPase activity (Roadblock/LC7/MglB family)